MSRQKILDAAVSVFSKAGYHLASMDEIAKAAGVAKGTLYYHFPGKAQLFKVLITEALEYIINDIMLALADSIPITDQLKKIIDKHIDFYMNYSELASIFLNGIGTGIDQTTLEDISLIKKGYIEFIAELLKKGSLEGTISNVNFELTAAGLISMLDGMCKYSLKYNGEKDIDVIKKTMYEISVSGIIRDK